MSLCESIQRLLKISQKEVSSCWWTRRDVETHALLGSHTKIGLFINLECGVRNKLEVEWRADSSWCCLFYYLPDTVVSIERLRSFDHIGRSRSYHELCIPLLLGTLYLQTQHEFLNHLRTATRSCAIRANKSAREDWIIMSRGVWRSSLCSRQCTYFKFKLRWHELIVVWNQTRWLFIFICVWWLITYGRKVFEKN